MLGRFVDTMMSGLILSGGGWIMEFERGSGFGVGFGEGLDTGDCIVDLISGFKDDVIKLL